jgi:hypothetical protein
MIEYDRFCSFLATEDAKITEEIFLAFYFTFPLTFGLVSSVYWHSRIAARIMKRISNKDLERLSLNCKYIFLNCLIQIILYMPFIILTDLSILKLKPQSS